jgi:hypothetical protein
MHEGNKKGEVNIFRKYSSTVDVSPLHGLAYVRLGEFLCHDSTVDVSPLHGP